MIKAPFNFVPCAPDVFFPEWASKVSQDIPFSGELSGTIKITIKAETPIFIRNGHSLNHEDNTFSHVNQNGQIQYFIPATSIKGCIRSVLEMMSFGKLKPVSDSKVEGKDVAYQFTPKDLAEERVAESAKKQGKGKDNLDLAECIFGHVNKSDSLKGRVQFSNCVCKKAVQMPPNNDLFELVLSSPHPENLPIYVKQYGDEYYSYDEEGSELNGWKRYVLRNGYWTKKPGKKDDTKSLFRPLNKGSVFEGTIRYHNLKPEELGALLCALTWHGEANCYHNIGLAKPFGFGRIKITIDDQTLAVSSSYIEIFESMMKNWLQSLSCKPNWRYHYMIKELFLLGSEIVDRNDSAFQYMQGKDSKNAKKNWEYLKRFSKLIEEKE